jgi:RNA polymerase sigma factor (sigma-70 family)
MKDTLLKVHQSVNAGKYSGNDKFLSWLMHIAHNPINDYFRWIKQMNTISTDIYESDLFNSRKHAKDNIEDDLIKNETDYDIRSMVSRLPDDQKELVILRQYPGFSYKEIARIANISINTALGRIKYTLINMRKMKMEEEISLSAD